MAKLDALKQKLAAVQLAVGEKLDKISFIRKWREKRAAAAPGAPGKPASTGPSPYSLTAIYRQGGTGTRLQVILVYVFALAALASTYQAGKGMLHRLSSSKEHEKLKKDYSEGVAHMTQKVVENAKLVSLGKFTSRAHAEGGLRFMAVDVWVRVSDPEAAQFAEKSETLLRDRVVDTLDSLARDKVNFLTDPGKFEAKSRLQEELSKAFPKGKVEDVFFQNLIVQ